MYNKKHEYTDRCFLCNNDLHYDEKKGFIQIHKTPLMGCIKLNTKNRPCKLLIKT